MNRLGTYYHEGLIGSYYKVRKVYIPISSFQPFYNGRRTPLSEVPNTLGKKLKTVLTSLTRGFPSSIEWWYGHALANPEVGHKILYHTAGENKIDIRSQEFLKFIPAGRKLGDLGVVFVFSKNDPTFTATGSGIPTLSLSIHLPTQEESFIKTKEFSLEEYTAATDRCNVHLGKSYIEYLEGPCYKVHIQGRDDKDREVKLELFFEAEAEGLLFSSDKVFKNKKDTRHLNYLMAVPRGDILHLVVKVGDWTFETADGEVWHDHNWSDIAAYFGVKFWDWSAMLSPDLSLVLSYVKGREMHGGRELGLFGKTEKGKAHQSLATNEELLVSYKSWQKYEGFDYPDKIEWRGPNFNLTFTSKKVLELIDHYAKLVKQNKLAALLFKLVFGARGKKAGYIRTVGKLTGVLDGKEIAGTMVHEHLNFHLRYQQIERSLFELGVFSFLSRLPIIGEVF